VNNFLIEIPLIFNKLRTPTIVSEIKETPFKHAISLTLSEQNGQEKAVKKHCVSGLAAETIGLPAAFCQRGTGMDALSRWWRRLRVTVCGV